MCVCVCMSWSHHLYLHCKEGRRLQQGLMYLSLWSYLDYMTMQQGCCSRLQRELANIRTQDELSLCTSLAMLVHGSQAQSHRSLEEYPGRRLHIPDSHCWRWSTWTISLILYICFHGVLTHLHPLISEMALD